MYIHIYISSSFYRRVNLEAAVNCFLVKVNRYSGLKVAKKRGLWDSKLILLMAAVGYVVGFGNVWCCCTGPGGWGWLVSEG